MKTHVHSGLLAIALLAACGEQPSVVAGPADPVRHTLDRSGADPRLGRLQLPRFVLEEATPSPEASEGLPGDFRDRRADAERGFEQRDQAPFDADRARDRGDDCFARCEGDAGCRLRCLDGLDLPEEDECLECGRETGFLPRPDLWLEAIYEGKAVALEWTDVDGASKYLLQGLRVSYRGDDDPAAMSWGTARTSLRLELQPGFIYVFYVVAIDEESGARSKPSRPVTVRL